MNYTKIVTQKLLFLDAIASLELGCESNGEWLREGFKKEKKSAEFSALSKTHPTHSQSAKKIKKTLSKNHF